MALEQRPSEVASVRAAAPPDSDQLGTVVAPDRGRETFRRRSKPTKPTTGGRLASMTFSVLVSLWAGPDRRPCAWFCGCPCQPRTALDRPRGPDGRVGVTTRSGVRAAGSRRADRGRTKPCRRRLSRGAARMLDAGRSRHGSADGTAPCRWSPRKYCGISTRRWQLAVEPSAEALMVMGWSRHL